MGETFNPVVFFFYFTRNAFVSRTTTRRSTSTPDPLLHGLRRLYGLYGLGGCCPLVFGTIFLLYLQHMPKMSKTYHIRTNG